MGIIVEVKPDSSFDGLAREFGIEPEGALQPRMRRWGARLSGRISDVACRAGNNIHMRKCQFNISRFEIDLWGRCARNYFPGPSKNVR